DGMRRESGFQMLGKIVLAAAHRAGVLHGLPGCRVVAVFLPGSRRIERDDRVGLQCAKDECEPAANLDGGNLIHAAAAVIQIENILEAEDGRHLEMVLLAAQDVLRDGGPAMFLVVAGADDVSGIALFHQLGAEAACEIGHIVQMGMYDDKDLAMVRLAGLIFLNYHLGAACNHSGTACSSTNLRMFAR